MMFTTRLQIHPQPNVNMTLREKLSIQSPLLSETPCPESTSYIAEGTTYWWAPCHARIHVIKLWQCPSFRSTLLRVKPNFPIAKWQLPRRIYFRITSACKKLNYMLMRSQACSNSKILLVPSWRFPSSRFHVHLGKQPLVSVRSSENDPPIEL